MRRTKHRARARRRWLIAGLTAAVLAPAGAARGDAPTVTIRAETRIQLHMERRGPSLRVRGVLRDDRGTPLVGRDLEVEVLGAQPQRASRVADNAGAFEITVPAAGAERIVVAFASTPLYAGTRVERPLDPGRADVRLGIAVSNGGRIDLDGGPVVVTVTADSDAGKAGLSVRLADEIGRTLGEGKTDRRGRVTFELPPASLGPPGPGRIVAQAADDERRSGTTTEYPIVRLRQTTLSLESTGSRARAGVPVSFLGALTVGAAGDEPVSGAPIGVFADGIHVGTTVTDGDGRYEVTAPLPSGAAKREVVARFESARPGYASARSVGLEIPFTEARGRFVLWALGPLALTALLLIFLRRRAPAAPAPPPQRTPGVVKGKATVVARTETGFSGTVVDVDDGVPVVGASIAVALAGATPMTVATEADGTFGFGPVPPGRHVVRVTAPGYAAHEHAIEIPHRGEWTAIELRLTSLRRTVALAFRRAVWPREPDASQWSLKTNRELADAKAATEPSVGGELRDLERAVGAIYYGPEVPEDGAVSSVLENADALARRPSGADDEGDGLPRSPR